MDELGKQLSILSFAIIGIIGILGIVQGKGWLEVFTVAVSLAVAAIPEGLPVVVAVTLALGVLRLSKQHAIVKKLGSVESLGSVDVICVDKTGTLTTNKMVAKRIITVADEVDIQLDTLQDTRILYTPVISQLLDIANLCNNSFIDEDGHLNGQPTEVAVLDILIRAGITDKRSSMNRISEIPFNPEEKWMSVEYDIGNGSLHYVKGAVEPLLDRSFGLYAGPNHIIPLTSEIRNKLLAIEARVSSEGLRLLSFAFGSQLDQLLFVGFFAIWDPPRPESKHTVEAMIQNRIQVVMITGDSRGTAVSIAKEIGIPNHYAISGKEIESMSSNELKQVLASTSIFYRTTPTHKLTIVRAFQEAGHTVAMTGDGV
jgi:Ca2+-transporting ATPase